MRNVLKIVLAVGAVFFLHVVAGAVWGWNTSLGQINFGWPLVTLVLLETIIPFIVGLKLIETAAQENYPRKNTEAH